MPAPGPRIVWTSETNDASDNMEDFNEFRSAKLRVATYDGPLSLAAAVFTSDGRNGNLRRCVGASPPLEMELR